MPVTRNPALANSSARGSPTYPRPITPQRAVRRSIFSPSSCRWPSSCRSMGGSLHVAEILEALAHLGLFVVGVARVRHGGVRLLRRGLGCLGKTFSHGSLSCRTGSHRLPVAAAAPPRDEPGSGR